MEQISKRLMNWASILEPNTLAQAVEASQMPFIFPHLALMPDAHLGKGATVGSVIPTERAIIPAAVGVDIGCGMMAVETQWTVHDLANLPDLRTLHAAISRCVPLSAGKYNAGITPSAEDRIAMLAELAENRDFDPAAYAGNWQLQLGSLGSGNHFIELVADERNVLWLFLHSGSRGVGNKIAQKHIKVAQELCARWYIDLPNPDLAYLIEDTPEFWSYIREMRWAQEFARLNREEMMDRCVDVLSEFMGELVCAGQEVNCHHNYTTKERHFGRVVWLSRKGAIDASEGTYGLIPGSMGAASYLVRGKGNRLALNSSPHGAGREYSRSRAKRTFTRDSLNSAMEGIVWGESDEFLDEHPQAYKPIDVVMKDAADLVEVVRTFRQLVNVKGD